MKRKFTIVFILLNMIVNFFVLPNIILADDECPAGCSFDVGIGQCVNTTTGGECVSNSSSDEDWSAVEGSYYTSDGSTMCKVRTNKEGKKEPYECYRVDSNGNIDYSHKIALVPMEDLQVVSARDVVFTNGTAYYPLTTTVDDLFDVSLDSDALSDPVGWASDKKSYIVIKEVEHQGKQVFWNVPNVQSLIYNILLKSLLTNSGYSGEAYNVKETERFVAVGTNENFMRRYGFKIPNIKYIGEYPLYYMSMNTLLPTNVFQGAWRAFKATISGSSFINSPDKKTYASLYYIGHDYGEAEDSITTFIAKNWHEYFVSKLYDDRYATDVLCKNNTTFCSFIDYSKEHLDYKEQGVKLHVGGSNYYYHGTITQMFVDDSATQASQSWISNYFPKKSYEGHKQFVADEEITTKTNEFGTAYNKEEDKVYNKEASFKEISVEDFTTFDEELNKIIEFDKSQAMIIADNRCRLLQSDETEITEKRDGLKDWHPENYRDEYVRQVNGTVEVSDTCDDEGGTAVLRCATYCNLEDGRYKYIGNYGTGEAPSSCSDEGFDQIAYDKDVNYWENGSDGHSDIYHGKNQQINSIRECVEQYDKLYDRCVENVGFDAASEEDVIDGLNENQKICPLETYKKYKVQTYKTDSNGAVIYGASKLDSSVYSSGSDDTKVNAVVDNGRENWFRDSHAIYNFERNLNYDTSHPQVGGSGTLDINFNKGYNTIKFFGSEELKAGEDETFPNVDLVKEIVGVDAKHHNKISGAYAKNVETVAKHRLFKMHWYKSANYANLSKGQSDLEKNYIFYNQCLITSDADNQCVSSDGNQLSIKNIYADNSLWDIEMNTESDKWKKYVDSLKEDGITISDEDLLLQNAELIIQKIQASSGQYYDEVMNSIIQLMIDASGGDLELTDTISKRVLPYNVNNMVEEDKVRVKVVDPRFNETLVDNATQLNLGALIDVTHMIANKLLSWIGTMSEITVKMVEWMNFGFIESIGLSPTTMWTNTFMSFLIAALVIWFIVKLVMVAIRFVKGSSGLKELISNFITFFFLLSILVFTSIVPESTWSTMKNGIDAVMNLGETFALRANPAYEALLTGSTKGEVAYWTPYFDSWSLYNTGYGILDSEQLIVIDEEKMPETTNLSSSDKLWSLMLAESFTDYHNNHYVDDKAYRVVDHFMAPRVTISSVNTIDVQENENYNGMFQNNFIGLFPKLLGTALLLFVVFVKFLTFLYLWYMLYMLMINLLLSFNSKKDIKKLFVDTFVPALELFIIGLWASVIMYTSAISTDLVGVIVIIVLGIFTLRLLMAWKEKFGHFPKTLNPVYSICALIFRPKKKGHKGAII